MNIVLLGDSIFDNAPYVDAGEDVISYLGRKLPADGHATLLAIDGSVVPDVSHQVNKLPKDATHLFLSIGGNDALRNISYLSQRAQTVAEVVTQFSGFVRDFRTNYVDLIEKLASKQLPLTLCTIYNPSFEQAQQQVMATTAIALWNDVIIQTALSHALPIIELRQVFTEPSDYANPIEPSALGADKLSSKILDVVKEHDFSKSLTVIYGK